MSDSAAWKVIKHKISKTSHDEAPPRKRHRTRGGRKHRHKGLTENVEIPVVIEIELIEPPKKRRHRGGKRHRKRNNIPDKLSVLPEPEIYDDLLALLGPENFDDFPDLPGSENFHDFPDLPGSENFHDFQDLPGTEFSEDLEESEVLEDFILPEPIPMPMPLLPACTICEKHACDSKCEKNLIGEALYNTIN